MFECSPLLATGVGAVAAGLMTAAILIVWRDLGPGARLTSPRRVALVVALAGGVIAFGLEPTVIETPSPTGRDRLVPTLFLPEPDVPEPAVRVGRPVWEALPTEAPAPPGNPTTPEKVALGRKRFSDPASSRDGTLTCASCHDLEKAGSADGRPTARGIDGRIGARNTPTVYDASWPVRDVDFRLVHAAAQSCAPSPSAPSGTLRSRHERERDPSDLSDTSGDRGSPVGDRGGGVAEDLFAAAT